MTRATSATLRDIEFLSATDGKLWSVLSERSHPLDAAVLLAVPLVLLAVFSLPMAVRHELALAYESPTLLTALTSHFVHLSASHLLVNLGGYTLVVGTAYLLSVASGHRRQFFVVFATFLLALPFALSALNLAFPRPRIGVGFSGIVLAFVGYLPVAILNLLGARVNVPVNGRHSQWLFCFAVAVIALLVVPAGQQFLVVSMAVIAGAVFLFTLVKDVRSFITDQRASVTTAWHIGEEELLVVGAVVFVGYLFVAFPASAQVSEGVVVNVYSHALGFCLGYLTVQVGLLTGILD